MSGRAACSAAPAARRMSSRWISISTMQPGQLFAVFRLGVHRLDQRGLAHPPRAPQHRVVGRQPAHETQCVLKQDRALLLLDALQQAYVDPLHVLHRRLAAPRRGARRRPRPRARSIGGGGAGASRSSASVRRVSKARARSSITRPLVTASSITLVIHRAFHMSLTKGARKVWSRFVHRKDPIDADLFRPCSGIERHVQWRGRGGSRSSCPWS